MYNYYTIYSRFLRCLNTTTTIDRVCAQNLRPVIFSRTLLFSARLENRTRRASLLSRPTSTLHRLAFSSTFFCRLVLSSTVWYLSLNPETRSRTFASRSSTTKSSSSSSSSSSFFFLKRHQRWWWCPSAAFPSSKRTHRWRRRNPLHPSRRRHGAVQRSHRRRDRSLQTDASASREDDDVNDDASLDDFDTEEDGL